MQRSLFTATLFISATLLFVLQPLFGKTLLPFLGGAPAVWNTCLVFYQTLLFLAYLYAHCLTTRLTQQRQIYFHLLLLAISFIALPLALPENINPPTDGDPTLWLMGILLFAIGLPFFVVASSAPLLQKWFAETGHRTSQDPYYLYAASNAGSILALLSYPFLIEPAIGLLAQRNLWSIGYGLLCVLIVGCAIALWRSQRTNAVANADNPLDTVKVATALSWKTKGHWLALAFVPSSLLLGLTHFISTDIASMPLLWIIPLFLYLLSFVLVFSGWAEKIHPPMIALQAFALLPFIAFAFVDPAALPFQFNLLLHLLVFFLTLMVCHGELAKRRPATKHLTTFYLIMSLGGMLGGLFNTLVAPFIFDAVYEYPLMLAAALLLRPSSSQQKQWTQLLFPALLLGLGLGLYWISGGLSQALIYAATNALILGAGLSYSLRSKPLALSLFTAVILLFALGMQHLMSAVLYQQRSFFGVSSVRQSVLIDENKPIEKYHELFHGTTKHGAQRLAEQLQTTPLTYYSRPGPIGQLFAAFDQQNADWTIGSVGLGTGTLACYAKPQQDWTFYEIDPLVISIANNPNYFTYLARCGQNSTTVVGDARLSLAREQDNTFDLLIMDAFSSDAIPLHLLTREAIALYFAKLKPEGMLALHISNRHLALKKVLSSHASYFKAAALLQEFKPHDKQPLVTDADWVVMAKTAQPLHKLQQSGAGKWQQLPLYFAAKPWTDDFTTIIGIWR